MTTVLEAPCPRRARPLLRPAALVVLSALLAPAPARAGCAHYVLLGDPQPPGASPAGKADPGPRAPADSPAPCRGPSCSRQTPVPPAAPTAPTNPAPNDWPYLGEGNSAASLNPSLDRPAEGRASAAEGTALPVYHPPR
jgi:hypothetical protein